MLRSHSDIQLQHSRHLSKTPRDNGQPPLWAALPFAAALVGATIAATMLGKPVHDIVALGGLSLSVLSIAFGRPGLIEALIEIVKERRSRT